MTAFSTPGSVPSGAPAVGTPGGGGFPTTPSPTLDASLALLPAGLTPVSVFPPFLNPRTVPAVGVIFREPPVLVRKKRGSTLNNLIHEVKKLWAKFQKRLQCVGPTLTRKFSRKSRRVSRRRLIPFQYYKRRNKRDLDSVEKEEDFILETVEDCFDDVPKPRFGLGSIFL